MAWIEWVDMKLRERGFKSVDEQSVDGNENLLSDGSFSWTNSVRAAGVNCLDQCSEVVLTACPKKVPDLSTCSCCSRRAFLGTTLVALFSTNLAHADRRHVVKKGETLFGLSRKYGVSVKVIADANGLTTKTKLRIGQKLAIPNSTSDKPKLKSSLKKALDRTTVRRGLWKNIVIHHSATRVGNVKGMDEYHRKVRHMENGLAYHFVIGNGKGMPDGEIAAGGRWSKQLPGGHLASEALNRVSLGVCLVGNFQETSPTSAQIKSLAALINYLMGKCRLTAKAVKTHQQINTVYTECPGKKFPVSSLKKLLV